MEGDTEKGMLMLHASSALEGIEANRENVRSAGNKMHIKCSHGGGILVTFIYQPIHAMAIKDSFYSQFAYFEY